MVVFGFADTGAVHAAAALHGADKVDEQFEPAGARLRLRIPATQLPVFVQHLRDATRDRATVTVSAG